MFYALKDKDGRYISNQSTLGGSCISIFYTENLYHVRTSDERTMKRLRTLVNRKIGEKPGFRWGTTDEKPISEVDIVKLELREVSE